MALQNPEILSAPHPTWSFSGDDTQKILELIAANPVCGVIAPTGSGKSTTLIEAIYKNEVRIFVVELTIPAVENLYRYMAARLGKENVGWAAEGNVHYDQTSKLVYCTAGHMRRKMLNLFEAGRIRTESINFCDVLVIDEAHAGGLDADVVMELWKIAYSSGNVVPRLVLASATLNMEMSQFPSAPCYRIVAQGFPVTIEWHNRDYSPEAHDLYFDVANIVVSKHKELPLIDPSIWLVFCSGSSEVETVCETLRRANISNLIPLPIYSNIPSEQILQIFDKPKPGERRVIVATNIAEASITIDGLSGIFDTLTEKYGETSASGGFRLSLSYISKSSAQQRAGRTGRTGPGFCYRMCTPKLYETLPEQRPNDIVRVPLHSMVIELLSVGLSPQKMFVARMPPSRLSSSIATLRSLGMIDENHRVTPMGYFAPRLPLSVRASAILWYWIATGKPLFPCIAAVCLIDCYGPNYFWYPRKTVEMSPSEYDASIETHYEQYFSQYDSLYDLEVLLKMWNDMLRHFKSLHPKRHILAKWNTDHSLNNKKINECLNIARQVSSTLVRQNHNVEMGLFTPEGCLAILSPILRIVYKDQIYIKAAQSGGRSPYYINTVTNEYYRLDSRINLTSRTQTTHDQIIGIITAELQSKRGGLPTKLVSLYHPYNVEFTVPAKVPPVHSQISPSESARSQTKSKKIYVPVKSATMSSTPPSSIEHVNISRSTNVNATNKAKRYVPVTPKTSTSSVSTPSTSIREPDTLLADSPQQTPFKRINRSLSFQLPTVKLVNASLPQTFQPSNVVVSTEPINDVSGSASSVNTMPSDISTVQTPIVNTPTVPLLSSSRPRVASPQRVSSPSRVASPQRVSSPPTIISLTATSPPRILSTIPLPTISPSQPPKISLSTSLPSTISSPSQPPRISLSTSSPSVIPLPNSTVISTNVSSIRSPPKIVKLVSGSK